MDIRKLQRAIVDGLEDVKAQDIRVFNTSHLTELFDRVIVASGTSNRISRAVLLAEPPSLDIGEMTDKGSINQRAVLANRAGLVEELYADPPPRHVIVAKALQPAKQA